MDGEGVQEESSHEVLKETTVSRLIEDTRTVKCIVMPDGREWQVGYSGIKAIEIYGEGGHMGLIPAAEINGKEGIVRFILPLGAEVHYLGDKS